MSREPDNPEVMGLMTEEVYGLLGAGRSAQLRSEYLDKCFESLVNFAD